MPKRPKVAPSNVKPGSSQGSGTTRKTVAPVLKTEPHTLPTQYQISDDEVEVVESFPMVPRCVFPIRTHGTLFTLYCSRPLAHPSGATKPGTPRKVIALPQKALPPTSPVKRQPSDDDFFSSSVQKFG